jgi:flagellar hook-length control protein FliK
MKKLQSSALDMQPQRKHKAGYFANRREDFEILKQKIGRQMRFELRMALKKGLGELNMRLKPESLGEVKIKLILEESNAKAQFQVESQMVRDLMLSEIKELKNALYEGGFKEQEIDVLVDEREQNESSDHEDAQEWMEQFERLDASDADTTLFQTHDLID